MGGYRDRNHWPWDRGSKVGSQGRGVVTIVEGTVVVEGNTVAWSWRWGIEGEFGEGK